MPKLSVFLLTAALLLVAAAPASSKTVLVKDSYFSPEALTVSKGATLKFVWKGNLLHNVARGKKILITNRKKGSGKVKVKKSMTLNCTLHKGMDLRVSVR